MKNLLILLSALALDTENNENIKSCPEYDYSVFDNKCNFPEITYQVFIDLGIDSKVVNKFENNSKVSCSNLKSKDVIIVDFNKSIDDDRLYVISYSEKKVKFKTMVSHAFNTGGDYPETFSNVPGSNYSSKGLFKIHERVVRSIAPYSFPVSGLDSENSNAYKRNITIHRSLFNDNDYVGHSYGCFALTPESIKKIKEYNIAGSYLYAFIE